VSSANVPPGCSTLATFAQPTEGSIQWNAVAEKAAANSPSGSSSSSKRPIRKVTFGLPPIRRRATSIIRSPGSTASTCSPRAASTSVSLPVPQPISSTADPEPSVAIEHAASTISAG
jgi:hypothetical protein